MDAEADDGGYTCGTCLNQFLSPLSEQHIFDHKVLKSSEENVFVKTLFNELQKSITITTSEILTIESPNANFRDSVQACNTNQFVSTLKNCPSLKKAGIQPEDLPNLISSGIASSLKPFSPPACNLLNNISQNQIVSLSSDIIAHLASDETISAILSISNDNFIRDLDMTLQASSELKGFLEKDPIFKALKRNPTQFKNLFSSLRGLSTTEKMGRINTFRNSPEIISSLDQMFKDQCEKAYKSFSDTVCASDFSASKVDLGNLANYSKVSFDQFDDEYDLATEPKVEARNFELLSFCNSKDNPSSKYSLEDQLNQMNGWMLNDKKNLTLKSFQENLNNEKSNFNERICNAECETSSSSTECFLKNRLSSDTAQGTPIARTQYSGGALDLIRSITGTPSKISKEDKEVLISYGILPQDDGSYITPSPTAPTGIASASPGSGNAGATTNRTQNPNGRSTNTAQFAESQQGSQSSRRQQQSGTSAGPYSPIMSPEFSSAFEEQLNDLSDLTNQERQRFNQFQEEMARRLSRSNSSAPSRTEVERVAQAVARERGANLSPQRRQQFVSSYVDAYDQVQNSFNTAPGFANAGGVELPPSSGPSQSETNMQNALEKMALTQQARASGGTGSISGGGSSEATAGRSPANTADTDSASLSVRIRLDDLQTNPQQALAGLPATLPDSFILEIEKNSQVYRYEVLKNGSSFRVSQLNGGSEGRVLIARLEKLLKDRAPERIPEQQAALPVLKDMFSRAN